MDSGQHNTTQGQIPVTQLRLPLEGLRVLYLCVYHFRHHVPGVDVYRADGHDLLAVQLGQVADKLAYQCAQLGDLL